MSAKKRPGDTERILEQLRHIAYADAAAYLSPILRNGALDGEVSGCAVSELTVSKDGAVKCKLYDKMKALELLGRYTGLFDLSEPEPATPPVSLEEAAAILQEAAKTIDNFEGRGGVNPPV